MRNHLYWNTVTLGLKSVIHDLMHAEQFDSFRLVGGTSLSLQLGHRMSDDIDLFTNALYDSIDFNAIDCETSLLRLNSGKSATSYFRRMALFLLMSFALS